MTFFSNIAYIWLAAGAIMIVFEALTTPGLGLFLGGLGAICTGLIVESGLIHTDAFAIQVACFFSFTILWAVILWKPLMKFRSKGKNKNATYNDVVGSTAIVGEQGLKRGQRGQVRWSGTIMNAELDNAVEVDFLPAGTRVEIKSVSGNIFTVIPK